MASSRVQSIPGLSTNRHPDIVYVSRVEHDNLVEIARRYANLRQGLLDGGVVSEALDILSGCAAVEGSSSVPIKPATTSVSPTAGFTYTNGLPLDGAQGNAIGTQTGVSYPGPYGSHHRDQRHEYKEWGDSDSCIDGLSSPVDVPEDSHAEPTDHVQQQTFKKDSMRSVQLINLPDSITHADITSTVRGGQLLDVFLRRREKTAVLHFVHPENAAAFYEHVRKNDLYIKNKRVDIQWNDHQYNLRGHIANKVAHGATRNLVVRRCDPNITEEIIREDLDHINNLVVIRVEFVSDDCFINLNSIPHAMYARTCMMSRRRYKGTRIDWTADECAQSLDRMPVHNHRRVPSVVQPRRETNSIANRFGLLDLDP